ncbi:calcium-dependent phosphotriesterase [Paramyrothecium foliicola]|nr:calcium-dependent phosphotriesterase [Paramyrothecium foliicola]
MATPRKTKASSPPKAKDTPAKGAPPVVPAPAAPPRAKPRPSRERLQKEAVLVDRLAIGSATAVVIGIIYRMFFYDLLAVFIGFNRTVQPIEDFPYDCQRLAHPLLEACEDLWIDDAGRKLYATCSSVETRSGWNPGANMFNHSTRTGTDHITVLDIDQPGSDGLFGVRQLEVSDSFHGDLDLLGMEARNSDGHLRFWLVNHRLPLNATTGEVREDASSFGANSTIEIFDLSHVSNKLEHVKTIYSDAIITPNSIAVSEDGLDFFVTNSHHRKAGLRRDLEGLRGGGSVAHCRSDTGICRVVAQGNFNFANGIVRGSDGLYYVASTLGGTILAYKYDSEKERFFDVNALFPKVSLDNLSLDSEGNIIAVTLPFGYKTLKSIQNPYGPLAPAAVLKIVREDKLREDGSADMPTFNISTIIEDKDSKFLPTATVAVHDVKTQRLFLSGVASQFITVCEKRS